MTSLYETLKASKLGGTAPDMFTALMAKKLAAEEVEKTLSGIPPLTFKSNGQPLISWQIDGNTVQSATPTPDNPVTPDGCGERTGNLFDLNATDTTNGYVANSFLNNNGEERGSNYYNISEYIDISGLSNISISGMKPPSSGSSAGFGLYNSNKTLITSSDYAYGDVTSKSFSVSSNVKYIRISYNKNLAGGTMLNSGSTPLPYEPYGYKIPILSANTTTNIYLGEVETTRKIKKLVLTGNENWENYDTTYSRFELKNYLPFSIRTRETPMLCTHYIGIYDGRTINEVPNNAIYSGPPTIKNIYIKTDEYTTKAAFKTFLANQYANGTPVTIYTILEAPETGIVNEPLMKIGDYADTVSMEQAGVSIPTNNGSTTMDVDTIVKPSEVYIKYHTR